MNSLAQKTHRRARSISGRFGLLALLLLSPLTLSVSSKASDAVQSTTPTLSVTGHGTAEATPDIAIITTGVVTESLRLEDALSDNTRIMTTATEALQKAGVEDRDIQTTNLRIDPIYEQYNANRSQPPRIVGYRIQNDVRVRIRAMEQTGILLDQLVSLGVNQMRGLSFTVAEPAKLEDIARTNAVKDAEARAATYAAAAGLVLGDIVTMREGRITANPQPMMAESRMAMAQSAPIPISGGEVSFSAHVSIVYALLPAE